MNKQKDPFILGTLAIIYVIIARVYHSVKHIGLTKVIHTVLAVLAAIFILKVIHSLFTHRKSHIIEVVKHCKQFNFYRTEKYISSILISSVLCFMLSRFIKMGVAWVFIAAVAVVPLAVSLSYFNHAKRVKQKEHELRLYLKDENARVLYLDNKVILVNTRKLITAKDFEHLSYLLSTTIVDVRIHNKYKHTFVLEHRLNSSLDYTKLKGSDRLTQILNDMGKTKLVKSYQEHDNHYFVYSTKIKLRKLRNEIENISHMFGSQLELQPRNGLVTFVLRENKNRTYLLDDLITSDVKPKGELPFIAGYSDGKPLILDLLEPKHCLVAGKTGSGKSVTFQGIIETLMYYSDNVYFYMMDFGYSAFNRYETFSNCKLCDMDSLEAVEENIEEIRQELERRKALFKRHSVEKLAEYNSLTSNIIPYIILAVDEANGFKDVLDVKKTDPLSKKVYQLLREGRKYGIFCLMAVQQTNDTLFFKSWKSQMSRFIHKITDSIDVENCSNNKEIQSIVPSLKLGEYLLEIDGDFQRVKACLSDRKHNKLYTELKQVYSTDHVSNTNLSLEKPEKITPVEEPKKTETETKFINLKPIDRLNRLYDYVKAKSVDGYYSKETYRLMAENLGTNKDTVNRVFNKLVENGYLKLDSDKGYKLCYTSDSK